MADFQDIADNWKGILFALAFLSVLIYFLVGQSEHFTQEGLLASHTLYPKGKIDSRNNV